MKRALICLLAVTLSGTWLISSSAQAANKIVHDAEYYIIYEQNGDKWMAEDKELDKKLAELRKKFGGPLMESVRRNYHPSRSGDIYIIQEPYWFLFDKGPVADMHGSPWRYDTHVPIIFSGPGIDSRTVHRLVHPVDVAPTIAAFLGMTPPASSRGVPLVEVLQD